jgi:hypothetical protein
MRGNQFHEPNAKLPVYVMEAFDAQLPAGLDTRTGIHS